LQIGTTLTVFEETFTIVGLSEGTSFWVASFMFMRHEALAELVNAEGSTGFVLATADDPSVAARLRAALPECEVVPRASIIANDQRVLAEGYSVPLLLLVNIALLVGGLLVGLNVAADALFYAAITGVEAGLVVVVADDPGMHSSQDEQDSRRYARLARLPCLEPADSQEARGLVGAALSISEQFDVPVMLRTTTRIAHAQSVVACDEGQDRTPRADTPPYRVDMAKYVMVPAHARRRRPVMEERVKRLAEFADTWAANVIEPGDGELGIVANGVAYQYAREVFPRASFLKLAMSYPLPPRRVAQFAAQVKRLIVVEELDPCLEEAITLMGIRCEGKSIFPLIGELRPEIVRECAIRAGLLPPTSRAAMVRLPKLPLPPRPPALCPGCPHRGIYVVTRKLNLMVNGDIGCYGLGLLPPRSGVHTCGYMGPASGWRTE
jgi:indolepyruvate ferredoxin oxidoreductase alpha subunit